MLARLAIFADHIPDEWITTTDARIDCWPYSRREQM
jgi:outer membrane receptor for Fe3+-dicitrate